MQNIYWFIVISRRSDSERLLALLQKAGVPRLYSMAARGTAKSQTLDLLGMEESEKAVHQTAVPYNKMTELMELLEKDFQIDLPGNGVALAIPLSGIVSKKSLDFFAGGHADDDMILTNRKGSKPMELIVVICNKGYTEDVMEAARGAGAGGGTILHAKGTGSEYAEKFFGLSIVDEKEVIYIVSQKENRNAIMHAITERAGAGTKAHALVLSLPVTDTAGFRLYDRQE